jgi:hypothetical protein
MESAQNGTNWEVKTRDKMGVKNGAKNGAKMEQKMEQKMRQNESKVVKTSNCS